MGCHMLEGVTEQVVGRQASHLVAVGLGPPEFLHHP